MIIHDRPTMMKVDTGIEIVSHELAARHWKSLCTYNFAKRAYWTVYGYIPEQDVFEVLKGDKELLTLWILHYTIGLVKN